MLNLEERVNKNAEQIWELKSKYDTLAYQVSVMCSKQEELIVSLKNLTDKISSFVQPSLGDLLQKEFKSFKTLAIILSAGVAFGFFLFEAKLYLFK